MPFLFGFDMSPKFVVSHDHRVSHDPLHRQRLSSEVSCWVNSMGVLVDYMCDCWRINIGIVTFNCILDNALFSGIELISWVKFEGWYVISDNKKTDSFSSPISCQLELLSLLIDTLDRLWRQCPVLVRSPFPCRTTF